MDALYASFPIYVYLNPTLGGYLLKPLLEYQNSKFYSNAYAALNLGEITRPFSHNARTHNVSAPYFLFVGSEYPLASGNTDTHAYGIEREFNKVLLHITSNYCIAESANMIIMSLAHAQASGDADLLAQHVSRHCIGLAVY